MITGSSVKPYADCVSQQPLLQLLKSMLPSMITRLNCNGRSVISSGNTFMQYGLGLHTTCTLTNSGSLKHPFDRKAKLLQRERAASMKDHHVYDYLKEEVASVLTDKIFDIKKEFKNALDLGCGKGFVAKNIIEMDHLHMVEFSPSWLELASTPEDVKFTKTVLDEEQPLPFEDNSLDIVLSNLSLHWVNELPGCLKEVRRVLKPDGVFLASMFGGDTLYQLRSSLVLAELEREGGFASHISPFTETSDIGALLEQAGFTLLTIDSNDITVGYPSMYELVQDLKGMGENNASYNRKLHLRRDTLMAAAAIYQHMYGTEEGIPATFEVIYTIGWKPDINKPLHQAQRGSGQISMKDIERLNELIREDGMEGRLQFMKELSESTEKKNPSGEEK